MSNKDYDVGYKRPPKEAQFKKGVSGNPAGRPKGSKNALKILEKIIEQKICVKSDGAYVRISKKEAILMQSVNLALKGDLRALKFIIPQIYLLEAKNEEKTISNVNCNQQDQEIIDLFLSER